MAKERTPPLGGSSTAPAAPAPVDESLMPLARDIFVRLITSAAGVTGARTPDHLAAQAFENAAAFLAAANKHTERQA